jgi:tRNA pseudouridine13 synthase
VFNAVLAARVADGSWNAIIPGDVARLEGSNSQFPVPVVDEEIRRRADAADLHPSGPLWGRGDPGTTGRARELEDRIAGAEPDLCRGLEAETRMDRRSLRVFPADLTWRVEASSLQVAYSLPAGSYATAVLDALLEIDDARPGPGQVLTRT